MLTALAIIQLIGGLLPIISQGILTVEQPGVPGEQKAAAVTNLALNTLEAVSPGTVQKAGGKGLLSGISAAIASLVSHFNHTGVLPKPAAKPAEGSTTGGINITATPPLTTTHSVAGPAQGA